MKYFVGAYAASPCHSDWLPEQEARYLEGLRALDLAGLELPFFGEVHRYDSPWLLAHLPREWDYVLTALPGTMEKMADDPRFGLASRDGRGRGKALRFAEDLCHAVARINLAFGRNAVRAVEIHSAPRQTACGEAFSLSLREMLAWDWHGAEILVEHCDRFREGQAPAKGFLPLADEIAALRALPADSARLLVNWGRSAIEERDAQVPRRHLQRAESAGVLGGLIFSGATIGDPLYGDWADSHAPFQGTRYGAHSILTAELAGEALRLAATARNPVLGLKMQALPNTLTVDERLAFVKESLEFLSERNLNEAALDPSRLPVDLR